MAIRMIISATIAAPPRNMIAITPPTTPKIDVAMFRSKLSTLDPSIRLVRRSYTPLPTILDTSANAAQI